MNYTVLGVSAGNGVMLYPFRKNVVGNIECRPDFLVKGDPLQWHTNFEAPFSRSLNKTFESKRPDVILGHPKCGMSSMFALSRGKKFTSHVDEPSLSLFFKAIEALEPKVFVFENLPKFLDSYSVEDLESLFYNYDIKILQGSVACFGNSQISRKRLLVWGLNKTRIPHNVRWNFLENLELPVQDDFELQPTSELLADLPSNGNWTEPLTDTITMYAGKKMTLLEAQKYWHDNPQARHYHIASGTMNTAPGVYINREQDYPLTVRKTNRQFNPNGVQMSPRELARIQGIPDSFKFYEDLPLTARINKGRVTTGNTPPYEVGEWIKSQLKKLL